MQKIKSCLASVSRSSSSPPKKAVIEESRATYMYYGEVCDSALSWPNCVEWVYTRCGKDTWLGIERGGGLTWTEKRPFSQNEMPLDRAETHVVIDIDGSKDTVELSCLLMMTEMTDLPRDTSWLSKRQ